MRSLCQTQQWQPKKDCGYVTAWEAIQEKMVDDDSSSRCHACTEILTPFGILTCIWCNAPPRLQSIGCIKGITLWGDVLIYSLSHLEPAATTNWFMWECMADDKLWQFRRLWSLLLPLFTYKHMLLARRGSLHIPTTCKSI